MLGGGLPVVSVASMLTLQRPLCCVAVFRSNIAEMGCHVGVDPNNVVDAVVKLRGLPYECSKEEVAQFFTGLTD